MFVFKRYKRTGGWAIQWGKVVLRYNPQLNYAAVEIARRDYRIV